jgi:hypothetical protein
MAKFKLEVLKKVNDPTVAETELGLITTFPKYIVVKKPFPKIVEYLVCVPFVGDQFDRPMDQLLDIDAPLQAEDVEDLATAVAARAGIVDGLILEMTKADGTLNVYTDDGNFSNDMIAEKKNLPNIGGHRAEEGWKPPSTLKPTGQAFNDSKLSVTGAEEAGFGKELG